MTEETYIVILFEKILEEFTEPFYGYLKFSMTLSNVSLPSIEIKEKLKYYFWVNVAGVSTYADSDENLRNHIFKRSLPEYIHVNPPTVNGFKVMTDEQEMMKMLLPQLENQGEAEYNKRKEFACFKNPGAEAQDNNQETEEEQKGDNESDDEDQIDNNEIYHTKMAMLQSLDNIGMDFFGDH